MSSMRRGRRAPMIAVAVLVLLVLGAVAPKATAQRGLGIEAEPGHTYPDVQLLVSVPAEVAGAELSALNVTLLESGEPRPVQLSKIPGEQLEVMIVIDTSGSMAGPGIDAARRAATSFVDRVPAQARIGLIAFGTTATLTVPPTSDHAAVKASVNELQATGETALYDGIVVALEQIPVAGSLRRQVVVLSDGADTASLHTLDDVASRLAVTGIRLDAVALATSENNESALQQLTQSGRGSFARATEPASLTAIYEELGRSVANQYRASFTATGHGPTTVRVELHTGTVVATGEVQLELPPAPPVPTTIASAPPSSAATGPATTLEPRPEPSILEGGGRWLLITGAMGWFIAIAVGTGVVSLPSRRNLLARGREQARARRAPSSLGQELAAIADKALEKRGLRGRLNSALERAGLEVRPGEFVTIVVVTAVVVLLLFSLIGGPLVGILAAMVVPVIAKVVVSIKTSRRQAAFGSQLSDALQQMSASLRTGYAVSQAMNVVATEAPSPVADEFRRVLLEVRLGRQMGGALQAMADRMRGEDVTWLVQAMEINREVGGDLAEVLDNVAVTIRERDHLRRQVKAISAEGRLSAYVLVAMPIVLAGVLAVLNPGYFSELTHGAGLVLVGIGAAMLVCGSFVLTRLVKIDF